MSKIGRDEVRHVARLARLRLTEQELDVMEEQLGTILQYVAELDSVSVEGVPPTFHAVAIVSPLREDEVRASLSPDEALAQAPEHEAGGFSVPRVLEVSS